MANALRFILCSIILTWFHLLKNGREGLKLAGIKDGFQVEKPFPSSSGSPYQNEVKCYAFDMEWYLQGIFHSHANKIHFHKKGCALGFWNSEAAYFPLENSDRETRTSFSNVPLLPEICHWNDPKSHVPSINVARLLACVAGVRKGRGRELGREGKGIRAPKTPFPFPFKRLPRRLGQCLLSFVVWLYQPISVISLWLLIRSFTKALLLSQLFLLLSLSN